MAEDGNTSKGFCLEGVTLGLRDQFIHRDRTRRAKQEDPDVKGGGGEGEGKKEKLVDLR
jgi:hypothetical protein